MVRDVLLNVVPGILRQDIYAVAALAGAAANVLALRWRMPRAAAMSIGFTFCFVLRNVAVWQGWQLPRR
ncbi:MAG TPA: TRIC cation channel family protein [Nakamurella sp.]